MKGEYTSPKVITEKVEMGVFGCYGSRGSGDESFWQWLKKAFGF